MDGQDAHQGGVKRWFITVIVAVLAYPFLLDGFHRTVGAQAGPMTISMIGFAALWLLAAFAVPALCLGASIELAAHPIEGFLRGRVLRLCYLAVTAPTAYTFLGVILYMLGNPVPDEVVWASIWLALAVWTARSTKPGAYRKSPVKPAPWLRVAHGLSAAVLLFYVLFHLTNHLFGLAGPVAHASVMKLGRNVYRDPMIEPLLVGLFLFQTGSGLRLAWLWSGRSAEPFRVFQIASGFYLSLFVLGHMNSVFVFARAYLHINTGWGFATGAPTGLIHDAWNIRLLPHYWLGVFFVLSHLATGLRVILSAHGGDRVLLSRLWGVSLVASALVASLILAGMCGLRLGGSAG